MTPLIFLDIDGVLNNHAWNEVTESCTIDQSCVEQLNILLWATGADIVLSSAWRYMISGGAMTTTGFEYLLRTHGVDCKGKIVGVTDPDEVPIYKTEEELGGCVVFDFEIRAYRNKTRKQTGSLKRDRSELIRDWLLDRPLYEGKYVYVVLDDLPIIKGHPFVQTWKGLTWMTRIQAELLLRWQNRCVAL